VRSGENCNLCGGAGWVRKSPESTHPKAKKTVGSHLVNTHGEGLPDHSSAEKNLRRGVTNGTMIVQACHPAA
jgi:hypothetical protein